MKRNGVGEGEREREWVQKRERKKGKLQTTQTMKIDDNYKRNENFLVQYALALLMKISRFLW